MHIPGSVEYFADLDAAAQQFLAGGLDVGDDEDKVLAREPGAAAVTFLPKMTEAPEPDGVNWITR